MSVASAGLISPGLSDNDSAQLTDVCADKDDVSDFSPNEHSTSSVYTLEPYAPSKRHQNGQHSGGNGNVCRVLVCSNLNISTDYDLLFDTFKGFGTISRMKLKADKGFKHYEGYVTFESPSSAKAAKEELYGKNIGDSPAVLKLISHQNLIDEKRDFIPKIDMDDEDETDDHIVRENPAPFGM